MKRMLKGKKKLDDIDEMNNNEDEDNFTKENEKPNENELISGVLIGDSNSG